MSTNINTSTESRALSLLGAGVSPTQVAAALGITESRVSQLISQPEFAAQVAELRFSTLSKHNERDSKYDSMEDNLLKRLEDCLPLMVRPLEILKAIQVINAAKRRGQSTPDNIVQQQTVINLTLPTQIINKFSLNAQNQVVQAGEQELLTLQSSTLLSKIKGNQSDSKRIAPPTNILATL
jgi:predicted transcriptional regulator